MVEPVRDSFGASRVAAVILAGGEGQRLGGIIKANVEVGGRRLLDRVAESLRGRAAPILVARGRIDPAALALPQDLTAVPDLTDAQRGPLVGVASAVGWLLAERPDIEFLASAAVDTPFFPEDFIGRALDAIADSGSDAVLASYAGQAYPTNALWRLSAVDGLPQAVLNGVGPRSLKRLAEGLRTLDLDWPESAAGDPFANVNTPADLAALEARAAGGAAE